MGTMPEPSAIALWRRARGGRGAHGEYRQRGDQAQEAAFVVPAPCSVQPAVVGGVALMSIIRKKDKRLEMFARLTTNGGNVRRTAIEMGVSRSAVYDCMKRYPDEFDAVKTEIRDKLISDVAAARKEAIAAVLESIMMEREALRDKDTKGRVRSVELAKTIEILTRVMGVLGEGGDDGGEHDAKADPDAGPEGEGRRDVAAILGE